jgi:hypothetical protein
LRPRPPQQALELARQFYEDNLIDLDFRSYEDCAGLDQIDVWDTAGGTRATWESDDYRLRRAAPELLEALNPTSTVSDGSSPVSD